MPQIDFEKLTEKIDKFTPLWFDEFTKVSKLVDKAEQEGKLIDIYASASTVELLQAVIADEEGETNARQETNNLVYALRALERLGYVLDYTRNHSICLKPPRLYRNDLYTTFHWKDSGNPYSFEAYFSVPTGLACPLISLGYGLLKPGQHKIFDSKASMRPGYEE